MKRTKFNMGSIFNLTVKEQKSILAKFRPDYYGVDEGNGDEYAKTLEELVWHMDLEPKSYEGKTIYRVVKGEVDPWWYRTVQLRKLENGEFHCYLSRK